MKKAVLMTKALILIITSICFNISIVKAAEPDGPDMLITLEDALEHHLILKIKTSLKGKTAYDKQIRNDLTKFYQERDRKPIWFENDKLTKQANLIIKEIKNGTEYGMNVKDIKFPSNSLIEGTSEQKADAELMMSRAVIEYARRAKGGQLIPQKISRALDNKPEYLEPMKVLNAVASSTDLKEIFKGFQPKHKQFWALKEQLDLIRNATGSLKPIVKIPAGSVIRPYDRHPHIALLRKRLNVLVPTKNGKPLYPEDSYDSDLIKAVKKFQAYNNIRATGIVNKTTRARLNKGKPNREAQILANMERWRWVPTEFGNYHVRVNIPEYLVRVVKNDTIIHQERVVTGKIRHATPTFSDEMETVVLNPYWNVPQSIIWNEMNGVAPKGYESRVVNGRVFIRQPPGPRNALGRVKFLFPNKHSVYLHDTPSKSLFNRRTRAFSHGCVRVRDPLKLAEVLLAGEGFNRKSINARVAARRNQHIPLKTKIPVHLTYFTMWVNDDGKVNYFNDIYSHDKKVIAALNGRPLGLEPKQRIRKRPKVVKKKPKPQNFYTLFFN
ncbi:MAG: L,D-transpeptidase family protein [Rhizobiales bacterium]|nr:L,D-transpeptidase family protein [Hyphomicrobiales bacterium]